MFERYHRCSIKVLLQRKKREIVIRSSSELELIKGILTDPKLAELAKKIDEVNPPEIEKSAKAKTGNDSDIIEI